MQQFLSTETLVIELLLIASIVAIVVRRLQVPYNVALVVVGLLLTSQSPLQVELTPELILTLFVPPLIFEAAFHLNLRELSGIQYRCKLDIDFHKIELSQVTLYDT